jgi:hypothetical protein
VASSARANVGDDVVRLARGLLAVTLLAAVGRPAQAQSLHLEGSAGYLSEWELSADVTADGAGDRRQFAGPLHLKHVGLCSANGPEQRTGTIELRLPSSARRSDVDAVLSINGARCSYRGALSGGSGFMDCSDGNAIPLTLSARP